MDKPNLALRFITAVWRGLDRLRRLLHLLLLLAVFLLLLQAAMSGSVTVPVSAALVIAPEGALVEQLSADPLDRAIARAQGAPVQETLVRDVLDALRAARDDERIKAVVLDLDGMGGTGLSKLQEVAAALEAFKASGKPVLAVGDSFSRDQYFLAAKADKIYMHPMGLVLVDGYSRFVPYYKTLLDKLLVDYHVWTVGEYKSFVEPITRDDMSAEDEEASRAYLAGLWNAYQQDVTAARGLEATALQNYADDFGTLLASAGGDTAQMAVTTGLIDELVSRDVARRRVREAMGETEDSGEEQDEFPRIGFEEYVAAVRGAAQTRPNADKVAVIAAAGTILDGSQPPGAIGGDSLAALLRETRLDERVKALVLRVDSGGGSAFASDVILREIEVFRESGRPVVVSMGSVAASGGYWIAMAGDEIWASPTTLTGSIGVGATLATLPRALDWLGIHVDGIGTTALAGAGDPMRPLGDEVKALIAQSIAKTYADFIMKVAMHRELEPEVVDAAAQGRVWTGADALERGLIDRLGGLDEAISAAAERAGLAAGSYEVEHVEPPLGFTERLLLSLTAQAVAVADRVVGLERFPRILLDAVESTLEPLKFVERLNDPRGIYAYCFCDTQ